MCLVVFELSPGSADVPTNQPHQLARDMKHADAMVEAGVCGSRENKLRKAELPDPAKPLEWRRLDHAPEHVLELTRIEFDEIVERVSDPLWFNIDQ